jgi:hypothetical protein
MFSSLRVGDQVSHPYKIMGKVVVLCALMLILDDRLEEKRF